MNYFIFTIKFQIHQNKCHWYFSLNFLHMHTYFAISHIKITLARCILQKLQIHNATIRSTPLGPWARCKHRAHEPFHPPIHHSMYLHHRNQNDRRLPAWFHRTQHLNLLLPQTLTVQIHLVTLIALATTLLLSPCFTPVAQRFYCSTTLIYWDHSYKSQYNYNFVYRFFKNKKREFIFFL